jgi:beta-lactamase superfamily II metal-dependent hydrolase
MPAIMDYAICNGINVYHRQPDWSKMGDKEINEWLTKWYYDEFISKCSSKGVNLITPTEKFKISLGENEYIEFYNTNNQDYSNYNSLSFGLLYVLGNSKCFLTGDMTYNSENLVGKNVIGQVDLHKTGHHGWNYSTQEWFAKELNAKYNILEALDINNETRKNARSVLQKNNLPIYSLASNGTIVATIKPSGVSLNKNTTDVLRDTWWQNQETNNWYWWKNNGQLAKSETLNLGGKNYNFDNEGICLNPY